MVAVQRIWGFGVGWGFFSENSSVEVGFLWEGAAGSLDDDVGGVVRCLHAPIQGLFLDKLRQETCGDSGKVRLNPQETGNGKCIRVWTQRFVPPTNASPAPFVSTMSLGWIFSTGNVSTLSSGQRHRIKVRRRAKLKLKSPLKKCLDIFFTLCNCGFLLPLGQHYDPLPLCIHFG